MTPEPRQPAPELTSELAQRIAGETSSIIGLNVLITDTNGVVIGSGDTSRLGTVHEASIGVLRTLEPATHTPEQARRLVGVRPGITLPVVMDGTPFGTVGLTGSPRRVRQFGLVVQRQTEILLRESVVLRSRLLREQAIEDLLRDIALFDPSVVQPGAIAARAAELGIDLSSSRAAVLVAVDAAGSGQGLPPGGSLARSVREVFADRQDVIGEMSAGRFAVLHRPRGGPDGLERRCERVVELLARRHGLPGRVGIGALTSGVVGLHESYQDASAALRVGPRVADGERVFAIGRLRVHELVETAAPRVRTRFVDSQLGALRAEESWPALRDTVLAWCESGFNLVRAAAMLHIHRNTLLHRLDKIGKVAGSSPRDPARGVSMYLACVAEQVGQPDNQGFTRLPSGRRRR
jgi:carbohydrate diacid regulator